MKFVQQNSIVCNTDRHSVYNIICQSDKWPKVFEPCISVETINKTENSEFIRITALINGHPMTWESQRLFSKEIFVVNSKILKPMPLVKKMDAIWQVLSLNSTQSIIILEHNYEIDDDVSNKIEGVHTQSDALEFIKKAINTNSSKELANIKNFVEQKTKHTEETKANSKWSAAHSIICNTSAVNVYNIIKNVESWPQIFDACVSSTIVEKAENIEIIKIEAFQNNKIISWNTKRIYFPDIFRIDFSLTIPMPFLKSMSGQWRVIPLADKKCILSVMRNFELLDVVEGIRDDVKTHEDAINFINDFVNENSEKEMLSIKSFSENNAIIFSKFKTKYILPFNPDKIYAFFSNIAEWPSILPHCNNLEIIYDDLENQEFIMEVKTAHGNERFRSIRRCDQNKLFISYFQPSPPAVLRIHTGSWMFKSINGGTEITSSHNIHINPQSCAEFFNEVDLSLCIQKIKDLIIGNSKKTIDACEAWLLACPDLK